ncbi:ABC transporter substrate-binding protein [Paenibacillus senegalensis]|uniref:ABC transporter substrate-binding protein n=1 Tax=Paenibacillus senegalensis TaxID=1465766 RepID=UPI000289661D|nr:sugar ABC transporter substrate-binding protein [Paenibacillus senegalensis]
MKSNMRKGLGASVSLVLLSGAVLAGCGSESGSNGGGSGGNEQITLTFETSLYAETPHKRAIDALVQRYSEINPDVRIVIHGADYENFWDKLTTEVIAGTQGDIVQMYPENLATYHSLAEGGAFLNLDQYIKGTDLETDLIGQELSTIDGSYYAISNYAWGSTGIFYRKSMFEEAGINAEDIRTLDDLKEAAIQLGGDGKYGFASVVGSHPFVASEWYRLVARPISGGIYFGDGEEGPYTAERINVNHPANVFAAAWWQEFLSDSNITPQGTRDKKVGREMFWDGTAAMNMDGPWFIGMTRERDESLLDDLGLIPQPTVVYEGTEYKPNPHNNPSIAVISQKTKHPEEAWEFLKWMASPEAQELISVSGMIPSNRNYIETDEYKENNAMAYQFYEYNEGQYDPAVMDPPIPEQGQLSQIIVNAAQDLFIGMQDAQTVLDDAAEKMKEVMSR